MHLLKLRFLETLHGPGKFGVLSLALVAAAGTCFSQPAAFPSTGGAVVSHPSQFLSDDPAEPNVHEQEEGDEEFRARNADDDLNDRRKEWDKAKRDAERNPQYPPGAQPSVAPPNAPIVRDIEIVGASGDDARKAMRSLDTKVGEPLDPNKQREDIRKLYEMGTFKPNIIVAAQEMKDGVKLQYEVQPNPKVNEITVQGNAKVPTNKILSELPVKAGQTYTIQAQNKIRESISRFYEEKGFNQAIVKVEDRPGADNSVNLAIFVDEGTKMKLNDVVINGNNSVGELPIKVRMNNKGSWGPVKQYYNESKFQEDLEAVKATYVSRGFLDVDVQRGDFIYAQDQSWVSPVINVNEGPRYRIGRVDARGYSMFSREEVLAPYRALQGDYYDAKKISASSTKVKNMYGDEGFLNCSVEPDFRKDPSRGLVDVDLQLAEGSRIYVGDVRIIAQSYPDDTEMGWLRKFYSRFSPPVRDEVVQREVQLKPGQVYRRFDEVRTRERLQALDVFESVKVTDQLSAEANVRDCVVEATQGNTGSLIFGVGFGDVEGGFIYANYIEHNLFGMARDLRVSALMGSKAQSFEVSYLDRYFLDSDIAAQFNVYHKSYTKTGNFRQTNTGGTAEFTRPVDDCIKDSIRLRLEQISFSGDDLDDLDSEIDDYLAATIRYRICQDTRDDTFFPTSGHIAAGSVETGVADGFLAKFEAQYAQYFCIGNEWVYAMNNQVGLLPYDADEIGYADRFFLGGSQDMRGFRLAGAGPHDSGAEDIPIGGATKILSQHELRYPFTDNLVGVLFADVGMLGRGPLEIGSPRASIGTGVRMRLPIASLAVDLAVPVIREDDDQAQFFHFTLTSAF